MSAIWFAPLSLDTFHAVSQNTLAEHLGIRFTEIGDDYLVATLPVDTRTMQPMGLLHGGASVVLAETMGSLASFCVINPAESVCVGIEVNANHVRAARSGLVTGICTPLHLGRQLHVWDIRISDDAGKLVCVSRLTTSIQPKSRL
ncbi:hotdog fold thioesterase [Leeia sp.]|uniref:hotdog fold thioesterase n=1 Tax=Leeia sp. TaxID=2884678 RepID=UPI0035B1648B